MLKLITNLGCFDMCCQETVRDGSRDSVFFHSFINKHIFVQMSKLNIGPSLLHFSTLTISNLWSDCTGGHLDLSSCVVLHFPLLVVSWIFQQWHCTSVKLKQSWPQLGHTLPTRSLKIKHLKN